MRPFLSASRRTDIPAWYSAWFMARIRAGWCTVSNPFRPSQVRRVALNPEAIQAIFFWTRNSAPIQPHVPELTARGYHTLFHYTITGLPRAFEPGVPAPADAVADMRALARSTSPGQVWWRYDPIILSDRLDADWHRATFGRLAEELSGSTTRVTLSLVDWYRKTKRRMAPLAERFGPFPEHSGEEPEVLDLVADLAGMARAAGMEPVACCEPAWEAAGVTPGACIDAAAANALFGLAVPVERDPGQRPHCHCAPSIDIGANHTCLGNCAYCYATSSADRARSHFAGHDPESESLV